MSVAGKVFKKMLLNRIYEPIDNIQLRPFQKGFRKRVETAWSKFIYWEDFSKFTVNVNYLY